ncbi:MAG: glycosyltransferase family 39 protein, partial [Chloroflexota bacterium]
MSAEFEQPIVDDRNPRTLAQFMPVVFVLLLAAWLRIIGGGGFPVSTDEGWTTWAISEPTYAMVVDILSGDRHPPAYFLGLAYWSQIAGDGRLALRVPSMLMGVLTVAMLYRVGADTFGRTAQRGREDVAWYGMLMFALLPTAVYYAQEIRHYGPFVASVVWSCLLFVRILRTPRVHLLVLYALSVALMFYFLYFAVWVVALHAFVGMVLWRGDASRDWMVSASDRGKLVAAWGVALLLYAPWLVVIATEQWSILTAGITAAPGTFTSRFGDLLALLELLLGGGLALTAGLYVVGFWG